MPGVNGVIAVAFRVLFFFVQSFSSEDREDNMSTVLAQLVHITRLLDI